jgi:Pyruvate/2-oxoacid:ferredoxin oxidoreductase delta subunit
MIGITQRREQGLKDPLLREVMESLGMDSVPLYDAEPPEKTANKAMIAALGERRDGEVAPDRVAVGDTVALTERVKGMARDAGADIVGVAKLQSLFIDRGVDLPHDVVLCMGVHEAYGKVIEGADAVEHEASRVYAECARISDEMARTIRAMGYPALAHHNGGCGIQAIPALYHAGFGELGRHGSLINPQFGANFRPGIVTTTMPLEPDAPYEFGVADYCESCNLCSNNCPGDAIAETPIETAGLRRWIVDTAKCYPYSRLRTEYCHICVDVCPYIHKENGNADYRRVYKQYMRARKQAGYKTPKQAGAGA